MALKKTRLVAKRISGTPPKQFQQEPFVISLGTDLLETLLRLPNVSENRASRTGTDHDLWKKALIPGAVTSLLVASGSQALKPGRSRPNRAAAGTRKSFMRRVEELSCLEQQLVELGIKLCVMLKGFGDFHLKTSLGITAADCLFIADAMRRKLGALEIGVPSQRKRHRGIAPLRPTLAGLRVAVARLRAHAWTMDGLRRQIRPFLDISLEELLDVATAKLRRDILGVERWLRIRPTVARRLYQKDGLYRDCPVVPHPDPAGPTGRRLSAEDLRNPELRARYLGASAYLELTSVDILCDLIDRAHASKIVEKQKLLVELAMQLLDECRHAELLAWRVEELGFAFGVVPVDLHTWKLYSSFSSLPEKLVIQQVLQEGLGLDSSAINVDEMQAAGDRITADLYAQIAADECNHVRLGLKWAEWLTGRAPEKLIRQVQKRAAKIVPETAVPVVPELRALCGYPPKWLESEKLRRGQRPVHRAFESLGSEISAGYSEKRRTRKTSTFRRRRASSTNV